MQFKEVLCKARWKLNFFGQKCKKRIVIESVFRYEGTLMP